MTRKHYKKFAEILNDRRRDATPYQDEVGYQRAVAVNDAIDAIAEEMCSVFAQDNPNFSRSKFLEAVKEGI